MKKLYYNPIEIPQSVRIFSSIFKIEKEYDCPSDDGPYDLDELFKLAASNSFEKVEVCFSKHNEAYYRDSKEMTRKVPVVGWFSIKGIRNGGGYLDDKFIGFKE